MLDQTQERGGAVAPARAGRGRTWLLTLIALALLTTVAVLQRPDGPDPAKVRAARAGAKVEPVTYSPLILMAKGLLWVKANTNDPEVIKFLGQMDDYGASAADRFRVALVAGEIGGSDAREERFKKLEEDLAEDSPLRGDIQTVRAIKAPAETGEPGPDVEPQAKTELLERHGWFARLILADQTPGGEAAFEREVARDGGILIGVLALVGLGLIAALLGGGVLLVVAIILAATGRLRSRFVPTPPEFGTDRALWIETFAVFLLAFLLVHVVHGALENWLGEKSQTPIIAALLMQWGVAVVLFWPLARGMSWERFRGEIGWHRGRGFWREVGAGLLGYLAGLPIYFGMALVVVAASAIRQFIRQAGAPPGTKPPPDMPIPDNKVFDMLTHASGAELVLLGTLVVLWAPLVEESIFRGALFRHIRQRVRGPGGLVLTVVLVAGAFAIAHAYVLAGVLMVATLGMVFALMREWRGSLIAPMTAHCVHNTLVLSLILTLLPLMRG